jgi:tRNA threonylcarbamoyl adenosine modification protein YeaZ
MQSQSAVPEQTPKPTESKTEPKQALQKILFINTALSHKCLGLLVVNNGLLADSNFEFIQGQRNDLEQSIKLIEALCKKSQTQLSEISHVAVVVGPGNFSSLRVGVIMANTLSANLPNCKLLACNSFDMLAEIAAIKNLPSAILLQQASKTELFVSEMQKDSQNLTPKLLKIEELDSNFDRKLILDAMAPQVILESLIAKNTQNSTENKTAEQLGVVVTSQKDICQAAENILTSQSLNNYLATAPLEPLYIKSPNIHVKN